MSLTLYSQLWGSSGLQPLPLGPLYIYPLPPSNRTTVVLIAVFGSHPQVLNSPLADRKVLGRYISCIYYNIYCIYIYCNIY